MTPEGWESTRLGDVATFVNGDRGRNYPARSEFVEKGIPFVNAGHIDCGAIDFSGMNYITEQVYGKLGSGKTQEHDILYCIRESLGKAALANRVVPGAIASSLVIIRASHRTATKYLFYVLTGHLGETLIRELDSGSAQPSISATNLQKYEVPLPPLPEQRKIAAILSSVDEAIETTRAVIDQLQVVKKAMMAELLTRGIPGRHTKFKMTEIGEVPEGWEVVPLGNLAVFVTSGSRGWAQHYSREGALFLRSQNVRQGVLDLTDKAFVTPPPGAEGRRTQVQAGDILVTITGNSVGNVATAPSGLPQSYVSQHVGLIRLSDAADAPFIAAYLSPGSPGNEQVLAAQYGQSKPGLNLGNLRSFLVPRPSLSEQSQIQSAVDAIQSRIGVEQNDLDVVRQLKSALSSVLLTGELRVRPDGEAP